MGSMYGPSTALVYSNSLKCFNPKNQYRRERVQGLCLDPGLLNFPDTVYYGILCQSRSTT